MSIYIRTQFSISNSEFQLFRALEQIRTVSELATPCEREGTIMMIGQLANEEGKGSGRGGEFQGTRGPEVLFEKFMDCIKYKGNNYCLFPRLIIITNLKLCINFGQVYLQLCHKHLFIRILHIVIN